MGLSCVVEAPEYEMNLWSLLGRAEESVQDFGELEIMVLALTWARIEVDKEDWDEAVKWARRQLGCTPSDGELRELQRHGMSVRQIADACGMSKSTVARQLSRIAA